MGAIQHSGMASTNEEVCPTPRSGLKQAIDALPFGWFHLRVFVICGLGWMSDGSEGAVLSFLLPRLKEDWGLSTAQQGHLGSFAAAGQAIGAIGVGYVSDRFGRRPAFIASVAMSVVFGAMSAFAPDFETMIVLRVLTGLGIGGNLPLAVSMVAELLPSSQRDTCMVLLQLFYEAGALLISGMAWTLMPNWRLFVLVAAAPAVVAMLLMLSVPESPQYLQAMGRSDEAWAIIHKMSGELASQVELKPEPGKLELPAKTNCDDTDKTAVETEEETITLVGVEIEKGVEVELACQSQDDKPADQSPWRTPGVLSAVICATGLWFGAQIGSGWYMWVVEIASRLGYENVSYGLMIAARLLVTASFMVASWLVRKISDSKLLIFYILGTGAASFVFSVVVAGSPEPAIFCITFLAYAFFFAGTWPIMYVVTPKHFPTAIRTTAFSVASSFSKLGMVVHPQIAGHVLDKSLLAAGLAYSCGWALSCASIVWLTRTPRYI